jgi:hypothetical protein
MAKGEKAKTVQQPTHRAIIHRSTRQIVGPVVSIDPEDWPYSDLPPSEILWRYMDIRKFEDLLTRSALYFSRPDKFKDPFEGRLAPANATMMSRSDAAFYAAYRIRLSALETKEAQEIMRYCVFISCWHRATRESRRMWDAYTSGPNSVVIASSVKALHRFVGGSIMKSPVKYHDDDFPRTEFDHTTLFFYKPRRYSFEREFRMLLTPGENESISDDEVGRHIPIVTKRIIHRVVTHPLACDEFKATVDGLLQKYLNCVRRENSRLLS